MVLALWKGTPGNGRQLCASAGARAPPTARPVLSGPATARPVLGGNSAAGPGWQQRGRSWVAQRARPRVQGRLGSAAKCAGYLPKGPGQRAAAWDNPERRSAGPSGGSHQAKRHG